jgi:hypothetical protein
MTSAGICEPTAPSRPGMLIRKLGLIGVAALLFAAQPAAVRAAPAAAATVTKNQAVISFPNTITFKVTAQAAGNITRIELEYGVQVLTCGDVVAKAFPDFTPASSVSASWTWDMRQSGSEPPGARIWWQWRITEAGGEETVTDRQEIVWLDSIHPWKDLTKDLITLHWYTGTQAYGQDLLDSAVGSLGHINDLISLRPDANIDLYIYSSYTDLQDAVLYEPGWTGGMSYGENNVIILGIPTGDEDWGKGAIAHELMHTVVDRNTFSCLIHIPQWLHEGLAMVSEGGPGQTGKADLQSAIDNDSIFPLRSLGGGFPEDATQANLAYDQSWSVVDYLLKQGTPAQMRDLLSSLHDGNAPDDALHEVYGFNVDKLDALWRQSVGAQPSGQAADIATATPTYVPTLEPLSLGAGGSAPVGGAATPTPGKFGARTATPGGAPIPAISQTGSGIPWTTIILVICLCLTCLVILVIAGVVIVARLARRKS